MPRNRSLRSLGGVGLLLTTLLPAPATAQNGPEGFFFEQPRFSAAFRGTRVLPRASSDIFDFIEEQLTVDRRDFETTAIAGDIGMAVNPRVDVLFTVEYAGAAVGSEYRRFVRRIGGGPISQTTSLRTSNFGASVKYLLVPRGHQIGQLAWVPRLLTPYVGAGGGYFWYAFKQEGDFVDFVDRSIFADVFEARGWTPSAHALAGAELRLTRRLFLTVEGRYVWAAAPLGHTFADFAPMDLTGVRAGMGVNLLFW